ncbi:hypothetical protein TNCV_5101781 [Trichonephila clavipes]|nr:hypothetical protein TNCV_5101781 [Trichonephila clavipes]
MSLDITCHGKSISTSHSSNLHLVRYVNYSAIHLCDSLLTHRVLTDDPKTIFPHIFKLYCPSNSSGIDKLEQEWQPVARVPLMAHGTIFWARQLSKCLAAPELEYSVPGYDLVPLAITVGIEFTNVFEDNSYAAHSIAAKHKQSELATGYPEDSYNVTRHAHKFKTFHVFFISTHPDPSSFANPTPLAHADTSRDVLPRGDLGISLPARSCELGVTRVTAAVKIELISELIDLSDDDNAASKTYESCILEGEPSSDEIDGETHGCI